MFLRIELTRPYPQLPHTLAQGFSAIVPHEAVEHYGPELGIHPVGSGPYRVQSFDTSKAVLAANHAFRQEPVNIRAEGYDEAPHGFTGVAAIDGRSPPFLDGIEIHFISEQAPRWISFTKGDEIQYRELRNEQVETVLASRDPPTLKPDLAKRYDFSTGLEAGFLYISFNFNFPEIGRNDDPERAARNRALRCAMIKGFDWKARNDILLRPRSRVSRRDSAGGAGVRTESPDDEHRAGCRGREEAPRRQRLDGRQAADSRLRRRRQRELTADVRTVSRLHGAHRLSARQDRVEALPQLRRSPERLEAKRAAARLP
jgi:ABC-type transport system substrate-binding protein